MPNDLRTRAIVLRRTNYGEADRILTFLTPAGKISALARSVRKEKSKLAGGIELFSLSEIVIHQKSPTSTSLGILTSSKMLRFYSHILESLPRLDLASNCLKRLDRASEHTDNPEYFSLLEQILSALDAGLPEALVAVWFNFNLARATGEEINLLRDTSGAPLSSAEHYVWDAMEQSLRPDPRGPISAPEIKLARFLLSHSLQDCSRINNILDLLPNIAIIAPCT